MSIRKIGCISTPRRKVSLAGAKVLVRELIKESLSFYGLPDKGRNRKFAFDSNFSYHDNTISYDGEFESPEAKISVSLKWDYGDVYDINYSVVTEFK